MSEHPIADDIKNTVKEGIEKIERLRSRFHKSVNFFIGIFIFFFSLFILLISVSQTATFREKLLDYILSSVNESINGTITVESLQGSLFTYIELRNITLTEKSDTVAKAGLISLRISPLMILQKKIVIREIILQNADVRMNSDNAGVLNFARIFPSSEDPDTTTTEFPFLISLENFEASGVNFSYYDQTFQNVKEFYDTLNLSDIKVTNLELVLNSEVDIDNSSYEFDLQRLSFNTNIDSFNVEGFSGRITMDTLGVALSDLLLKTTRSDISLNMILADYNLFGDFDLAKFSAAPVYLGLISSKFNFDDLRACLPNVDMLKGELAADMMAKGTLDELVVKRLDLIYRNTTLKTTGNLYNLTNVDLLTIDAIITNSIFYATDVPYLLPGLDISKYEFLNNVKIDTISYLGTPWDFKTYSALNINGGQVRTNFDLDINRTKAVYAFKSEIRDLSLRGLIDYPVLLNANAKGEGISFDPKEMDSKFEADIFSSVVGKKRIDRILMDGSIKDQSLVMKLKGKAEPDTFLVNLGAFFPTEGEPTYHTEIEYYGLNIAEYIPDSSAMKTNLSFRIDAEGSSFDPEKINGTVKLNLMKSQIVDDTLQNIYASLKLTSKQDSYKKLELNSSVGNIIVEGKVKFAEAGVEIAQRTDILFSVFKSLADKYFSSEIVKKVEKVESDLKKKLAPKVKPRIAAPEVYPEFDIAYTISDVDLRPVALFIRDRDATFEGEIRGSIKQTKEAFTLTSDIQLPFFRMWNGDEVNFISDASLDFIFEQDNGNPGINGLSSSLSIKVGRVYIGSEYNDIYITSKLDNSKISFSGGINSKAPKFSVGLKSVIDLTSTTLNLDIEKLELSYNDFEVTNEQSMSIGFQKSSIKINNFNLIRGYTKLFVNGSVQFDGYQDIDIMLTNFRGYDLSHAILGLPADEELDFDMNISGSIEGSYNNPKAQFTLFADSLIFKGTNFGSVKSLFDYSNKLMRVDIRFIELLNTFENAKLKISAFLPLDLAYNAEGSRLPNNKQVKVRLLANEFNLGAFGNSMPFVSDLGGILNADVTIAGNYENLEKSGYFNLNNGYFVLQNNNLPYNADINVKLDGNNIRLETFVLTNAGKVKNKGTLTGSGKIKIDGYNIDSMLFTFNGNLSVLSEDSRSVLPAVYGDLFLETKGPVTFTNLGGVSYLSAPLWVVDANLIFPPTLSAYSSAADNFIYKYVDMNPEITRRERQIQDLLDAQRIKRKSVGSVQQNSPGFDFIVGIDIKDEAAITFVFSQESNQSLTARLAGSLTIERRKGIQNIQGELELQDGSNLKMIKTFDAEGRLRFESDITNPYLDIVAMYKDYYTPPDTSSTSVKEEEVAVKVILRGPLNDLSKNFTQMENNIAVYRGKTNIDNNTPSPEYDKADALWFIITGKFKNELTTQEKTKTTELLGVDATAVAGSLLGGLLTAYLGDYVRSFEFRNVGAETKFNLSGKYKNLRYSVGGSTNVFQDFSAANVRFEYPIFENFLVRIERKEAASETNYTNEMINELGLKYRFEF